MDDLSAMLEQMNHKPNKEHVEWLTNPNSDAVMEGLEMETLCNWVTVGDLNYSIYEEYSFCDQMLLDEYSGIHASIPTSKVIREDPNHPQVQYMLAMNLFEGIGRGLFSTRSGVKAVNLDALVNFTNPSSPSGKPLVPADQPINYVDITNSDDFGFIEYMQWRKGEFASGFAFEIEVENHYTKWRKSKDGRIKSELIRDVVGSNKDSTVIRSFVQFVRSRLENGAHLVWSDGIDDAFILGDGVYFTEVMHKRYFMCKCILALGTVAENGTFILKINNMFTPFMVGLIYLMYVHFREITIVKPFTSRPWTSERYVVFRSRIARDSEQLQKHLLLLNDTMQAMEQTDVVQLVPLDVLQADRSFFEFIVNSNNRVMYYKIPVIKAIIALHNNEKVLADRNKKYRMWLICSRIWDMPLSDELIEPNQYMLRLVNRAAINIDLVELTFANFDQYLQDFDIDEWCFVPISRHHGVQKPTFFLGQGDCIVSMWLEGTWERLPNDKITLPRGTLVYGQLTTEFGDNPESTSTESLHIIDIHEKIFSGFSHRHFKSRRNIVKHMVEHLNNELVSMRPMMEMSMLPEFVVKTRRQWQTIDSKKKLVFKPRSNQWIEAGGLVLIQKHKAGSTERYLFWNWSANPYNIVNGIGDELHLGRFEKLLGLDTQIQQSPRFVSADRFVSSEKFASSGSWRSERNDRPLIYRNPNKTVPQ